jgi:hypothetical protein
MPILDESWSAALRKIGDLERPDHWHLTADEECYFFGEYTAGADYAHSRTNSIINNLKKNPSLRNTAQWQHKERAIRECGAAIAANIKPDHFSDIAFVPIPPSKCRGSLGYDDSVTQIARAISPKADVREIIYSTVDRDAMDARQVRRDPNALRSALSIHRELVDHHPSYAILLDDMLTTGCSFTVCKAMLLRVWLNTTIVGIFIARRTIAKPTNVVDLDLDF